MIHNFERLNEYRARRACHDLFIKLVVLAVVVAASYAVGAMVTKAFANANATVLQVEDMQ